MQRLVKRQQFLAMRQHGESVAKRYAVLQYAPLATISPVLSPSDHYYVGFTVTKKCGNAVRRNRIKRRLRAAMREVFPAEAQSDMAYVLIGRFHAYDAPHTELCNSLRYALRAAHKEARAA